MRQVLRPSEGSVKRCAPLSPRGEDGPGDRGVDRDHPLQVTPGLRLTLQLDRDLVKGPVLGPRVEPAPHHLPHRELGMRRALGTVLLTAGLACLLVAQFRVGLFKRPPEPPHPAWRWSWRGVCGMGRIVVSSAAWTAAAASLRTRSGHGATSPGSVAHRSGRTGLRSVGVALCHPPDCDGHA